LGAPILQPIPHFWPLVAIRCRFQGRVATVSTSKSHNRKENTMNILKHMEAVFVVTVAVLGSAALITEQLPEANARPHSALSARVVTSEAPLTVVYVTAKRMTPEQKRVSFEQERRATAGSRT
jgi:hypothetical protein